MGDLPPVRNPSDEGMVAIFDLTNAFLDAMAPSTWFDLIAKYNIETFDDFSEDSFLNDWPNWMIWGYAICLALGVLFMLFMPLCGCFYCCCRTCCGCCQTQEKVRKGADPPSCCRTVTCAVVLFVITGTMLAASLIALAAVPMLKTETGPEGTLNDVKTSIHTIDQYIIDSVDDVEQAIFPPFEETKDEIFRILDDMPTATVEELALETGVDPALYDLNDYTQSLPALSSNLTAMNDLSISLEQMRGELDTELTASRTSIDALLSSGCPADITEYCTSLEDDLPRLVSWAVYYNLSNTTTAASVIEEEINDGLITDVEGFVTHFESLSMVIENKTSDDINMTKEAVNEIEKTMYEKFDEMSAELTSLVDFDSIINTIETDIEPYIDEYYAYIHYTLLGFTFLAFLTALLYLAGIPLGLFCGSSASKHGANCILAGIAFTFIFSFLFWMLTFAFLLSGGSVQIGACRHLTTYDESMQALEKVGRTTWIEGQDATTYPYNLTGRELLDSCKADEALYTAFNLADNGYDITETLNLDNTDIEEELDKLANITFNFGTVTIVTPEVNASILRIDSETSAIDFEDYYTELSKGITKIELPEYSQTLNDAADATSDTAFADSLRDEADKLDTIYNDHVVTMESERESLRKATTAADEIVHSISLSQTMRDLTIAQQRLNNDINKIVQEIIRNDTDEIYNLLDEYAVDVTESIENDIAACRPVYDAITVTVQGVCVYCLDPINVLWFCFGWFMSFGILAIIFGTSVVGIFRSKAVFVKTSPADQLANDFYPMVTYK